MIISNPSSETTESKAELEAVAERLRQKGLTDDDFVVSRMPTGHIRIRLNLRPSDAKE